MMTTTTSRFEHATAWRDAIAKKVKAGDRFAGLYGDSQGAGCLLRAILATSDGFETCTVPITPDTGGQLSYPSVSELIAPAFWYERAAHDLSGLVPLGHPRLEPLLLPLKTGSARPQPGSEDLLEGVEYAAAVHGPTDVSGHGMFTIPFGPVRSGVVESIEFLIETLGEDIPHVNIRPHFKHRGVAKQFEGLVPRDGVLVAERVEGIASVAHALAFCHAIERIESSEVPRKARLIRVIHAELERIANHLDVAMRLADTAGQAVAMSRLGWHKESIMRLSSRLSGSRFGRTMVIPGGVDHELGMSPLDVVSELRPLYDRIRADSVLLMRTASFLDRLRGTGRLDASYAVTWGLLGPVGRASGYCDDNRWSRPTDAYPELSLPSEPASEETGDALGRLRVRWSEVDASFGLVAEALKALVELSKEPLSVPIKIPAEECVTLGWAEAPQGEVLYAVTMKDGRITRCYARSASFHNLVAFHDTFHGDVYTDFPFIEASFGLGYGGVAM